jgi:hypothetical protein
MVIGEERELERCDGTLDRQLGDVDDEAPSFEVGQGVTQRGCSGQGVELVNGVPPAVFGHARRHIRSRTRAGGDHELVVGDHRAVLQVNLPCGGVDPIDLGPDQVDRLRQQRVDGFHQFDRILPSERNEQESGLVEVCPRRIDHLDRPVGRQSPGQGIGDHRAGGARTQNDEAFHMAPLGHPQRTSAPSSACRAEGPFPRGTSGGYRATQSPLRRQWGISALTVGTVALPV